MLLCNCWQGKHQAVILFCDDVIHYVFFRGLFREVNILLILIILTASEQSL